MVVYAGRRPLFAFQGDRVTWASTLDAADDLFYRNFDGTGVVTGQVRPGTRVLRTRVELRSTSRLGETIIQTFAISCHADGAPVFTGTAAFGFFPRWAFRYQPGIPATEDERARLDQPSDFLVDLWARPARYCGGPTRLAGPMLLMLDRVTGFWPDGGTAGLGRLRAEIDVDADAWYFKAHFFEDPVQPGSLGNEAVCQLLQFLLIETGAAAGVPNPVFEPVMLDAPVTWKYRGQVLPTDDLVTVEVDVLEKSERAIRAQAWLWVDGRRIYHLQEVGMRIAAGSPTTTSAAETDHVLDPAADTWLGAHRPLWTAPSLPMMSTVDLIAAAASDYLGDQVCALRGLRLRQWVLVPGPVRLRTRVERAGDDVVVTLLVESGTRFVPVATAIAVPGQADERPARFAPLTGLVAQPLPYETAEMFHGPAFQYLTSWWLGGTGARGVIDAGRGQVPRGHLHPGLLDAMTHVIPHRRLEHWSRQVRPGRVAFPSRLSTLRVFEPLPASGELWVEARFAGFEGNRGLFPAFDLQLGRDERVLVHLPLVETLVPLGPLERLSPPRQRAFLGEHEYVDGFGLSTTTDETTTIHRDDVRFLETLPGALSSTYRLPVDATGLDCLTRIAAADHIARTAGVHPWQVETGPEPHTAHLHGRTHQLDVTYETDRVIVRNRLDPDRQPAGLDRGELGDLPDPGTARRETFNSTSNNVHHEVDARGR